MILLDQAKIAQNKLRLEAYRRQKLRERESIKAEFLVAKDGANGSNNPDNEGSHGPGNGRREARENPGVGNLLGYMRKRGDFENEYDNDLDEVLAELEYFSDDKEEDIDFKDNAIN